MTEYFFSMVFNVRQRFGYVWKDLTFLLCKTRIKNREAYRTYLIFNYSNSALIKNWVRIQSFVNTNKNKSMLSHEQFYQ